MIDDDFEKTGTFEPKDHVTVTHDAMEKVGLVRPLASGEMWHGLPRCEYGVPTDDGVIWKDIIDITNEDIAIISNHLNQR